MDHVFRLFSGSTFRKNRFQNVLNTESWCNLGFKTIGEPKFGPIWLTTSFKTAHVTSTGHETFPETCPRSLVVCLCVSVRADSTRRVLAAQAHRNNPVGGLSAGVVPPRPQTRQRSGFWSLQNNCARWAQGSEYWYYSKSVPLHSE